MVYNVPPGIGSYYFQTFFKLIFRYTSLNRHLSFQTLPESPSQAKAKFNILSVTSLAVNKFYDVVMPACRNVCTLHIDINHKKYFMHVSFH